MKRAISFVGAIAARGLAILVAAVLILGVIGEVRGRATDLSLWLVDVRDLSPLIAWPFLGAAGVALSAWAVAGSPGRGRRIGAALAALLLATLCLRDAVRYGDAVATGLVRPVAPVSLSLLAGVVLSILAVVILRDRGMPTIRPWRARIGVGAATLAAAIAFPIAQIAFFGTTDYRRPADAAVVLGARVYGDGTPSPLLADRIATGVELYRQGLVPILVMSGGDGEDGWNEADVMRSRAIAAGVPAEAILVDRTGVNTDATVRDAVALLSDPSIPPSWLRIAAVSQAYHLPRIQLAFSQAGIDVLTVPAPDPVPIRELPLLVVREVPAFWAYFLGACLGP